MKISVLTIGQKMPAWVNDVTKEYTKRISQPYTLEFIDLPMAKRGSKSASDAQIKQWKQQEAETILKRINKGDYVIALDERGKSFTTVALANKMKHIGLDNARISLIIGGPDGLDESVRQHANMTLALSELTFAHPMVRVILAEQIYRCISVIQGHPYHRQ